MAYSITFTSGIQNIGEDTLQMKLIFTVNTAGSNVNYSFAEKEIRVLDWGSNKLSFDLDDPLLVPAEYSCQLSDDLGYLKELFFNKTALGKATSKRPEIQIFVNGEIDYIGIVKQQNGFNYNFANNRIKLNTDVSMEDLNMKELFYTDEGGNPQSMLPLAIRELDNWPVVDMIEYFFSSIGNPISYSGGSLVIDHDWLFYGYGAGLPERYDIRFDELSFVVDEMFLTNDKGLKNFGDVMRKLALEYFAYTGATGKNSVFFKKLFKYNSLNSQNLNIIAHEAGQPIPQLTDIITTVRIKWASSDPQYGQYASGHFTRDVKYGGLSIDCINGFYPFLTNVKAVVNRSEPNDGLYRVYRCHDPNLMGKYNIGTGFLDKGDLVTKSHWVHRGNKDYAQCGTEPKSKEVHSFKARGISVDFLKGFPYDGEGFQIIDMEKLYGSGMTNLKAVNCGELE